MLDISVYFIFLLGLSSYYIGKNRAKKNINLITETGGLESHYGMYLVIWTILPAFIFYLIWSVISNYLIKEATLGSIPNDLLPNNLSMQKLFLDSIIVVAKGGSSLSKVPEISVAFYQNFAFYSTLGKSISTISISLISFFIFYKKIDSNVRAKNFLERIILVFLFISSIIAIMTTVGIILSLVVETTKFFQDVTIFEYFFGLLWSPQMALREGQVAAEGSFGAVPVFAGTFLITIIAMALAGPVGLFSAIYLSEYASKNTRKIVKPTIEILAGVPTVVYGFFAALVVGPFIRRTSESFGLASSSESALAAGLVMGIMIIPFISSLSDDVINSVPQSLREASFGVGATKSETIKKVIIPAALPGIVAAFMLAISRAIGETMIVVMAAGLSAKLTANPLDSVTTVTVQIVTLLVGDHEFDSTKTMAAFALGMTLFTITLILNIYAIRVVKKYREKYD